MSAEKGNTYGIELIFNTLRPTIAASLRDHGNSGLRMVMPKGISFGRRYHPSIPLLTSDVLPEAATDPAAYGGRLAC